MPLCHAGAAVVALLSQGRSALSVTLRYVLALVPGLYLGAVLWWERHPGLVEALAAPLLDRGPFPLALCSRWWRTPAAHSRR